MNTTTKPQPKQIELHNNTPKATSIVLNNKNLFAHIILFCIKNKGAKAIYNSRTVCKHWHSLLTRTIKIPNQTKSTSLLQQATEVAIYPDIIIEAIAKNWLTPQLSIDCKQATDALKILLPLNVNNINTKNFQELIPLIIKFFDLYLKGYVHKNSNDFLDLNMPTKVKTFLIQKICKLSIKLQLLLNTKHCNSSQKNIFSTDFLEGALLPFFIVNNRSNENCQKDCTSFLKIIHTAFSDDNIRQKCIQYNAQGSYPRRDKPMLNLNIEEIYKLKTEDLSSPSKENLLSGCAINSCGPF